MADWERRISELGVELRDPLPAGGLYAAVVVNGNTAYLSGTVAVEGPPLRLAYPGCLGEDLELADRQASARQAFISLLGNLRGAIDTFYRDRALPAAHRLRPGGTELHADADGDDCASQLMIDIFGEPAPAPRTRRLGPARWRERRARRHRAAGIVSERVCERANHQARSSAHWVHRRRTWGTA